MMEDKYAKDMLEDIKNLALNENLNGIVAMCKNEIEVIEKRTIKQEIVDASRMIEDAKFEITKLKSDNTDGLYALLNNASKLLRNLALKKELNTTATNENV